MQEPWNDVESQKQLQRGEALRKTDLSRPPADLSLIVRPASVTGIRRPGIVPRRLLMFGGGVLTGLGLADHNDGLPGAVADTLTRRSRRGVDITVVVEPDPLSKRALEGLRGLRLGRFDAVIVVVGERAPGVRTMPPWAEPNLGPLAALLDTDCAEHAPVFIYDSSAAIGDTRSKSSSAPPGPRDAPTSEETAGATRVRFRELPQQPAVLGPTTPFSPVTYEGWADLIVDRLDLQISEIQAALGARPAPSLAGQHDDETLRQRALRGVRLGVSTDSGALALLVREAKVVFGTAGAALVIVDDDEVHPQPIAGLAMPTILRDRALSNIAIQSDRPTVISDTHRDPRVTGGSADRGGPDIRFYAAYPVRTWDGYRIGALCIYDPRPRDISIAELAMLWDLAGQVEQHLWSVALRGRPLSRSESASLPSRTPSQGALTRPGSQPRRDDSRTPGMRGALKVRWTR